MGDPGRLFQVVTNLLDMTRLQAGASPRLEWTSVAEIVGSALRRWDRVLGDRLVTIDVPRELSAKQRDALEKFAKLDERDPRETLFS